MLVHNGAATYEAAMIEPAQIRAARALLGWNQDRLAAECKISLATIKNIERGATDPKTSTMAAIQAALERGGVAFLEPGDTRDGGRGVRYRK